MTSSYFYLPAIELGEPVTTATGDLLQVVLAINSGNTPAEVVDRLFGVLEGKLPFDRIGLALLAHDGELTIKHARSKRPMVWGPGSHAGCCDGSLGPIVQERKIRIIRDLVQYYREHPHSVTAPLILKEGIRSSLTLPLWTSHGTVGVLFFSSTMVYAYKPAHAEFLQAIAAGLSLSIERGELIGALQQANEDLKALDRLKSNFLSNLSHELRTPLTVIASYTYALQDELAGALSPEQHRYLETIIQAGDRLKLLLGRLFDLTELESGLLEIERLPLDLRALAEELVQELPPPEGLTLALQLPDAPLPALGDPQRVHQALEALLENAYKFTPTPGRVSLRAGSDAGTVWVEVQDSGPGIAPQDQRRVFEKFFQLDSGSTRTHGGSGLGLAIALAIAKAHQGDIQLTSDVGKGSTIRLSLPRRPEA